jgi:hypothetical protein
MLKQTIENAKKGPVFKTINPHKDYFNSLHKACLKGKTKD